MPKVGEKYVVLDTTRNAKNGLIAGKDIRIAHVGAQGISIWAFHSSGELKLLVEPGAFGSNFERALGSPANMGYASSTAFAKPYL